MLLRAAGYRRRAVLVGSGKHIEEVHHALVDEVHAPVDMLGFISLTPRPDNGLRSLGPIEDLPAVLEHHRVQEVIIADPDFPEERAVELVDQCHRRGVTVRVAPSTMEILVHRAEFVPGASVPLFELRPPVFDGFDYFVKRSFDFVGALAADRSCSARCCWRSRSRSFDHVARRRSSTARSGPGIGGEPFACFKFRTMRSDADQMQADLESLNEASGALFKIRRDPRLTRVGRLLRRFSLDELPQLFNVVRGQMSLVGPRPLPQRDFDQLEDWHKKRYLVLPGHDRPVAGLGPLRARLRRSRPARLPLPRALVGRARPDDPAQDRSRPSSAGAAPSDPPRPARASRPGTPRPGSRGSRTQPCREAGRAQARALAPLRGALRHPGGARRRVGPRRGRARRPSCSGSATRGRTRPGARSTSGRGRAGRRPRSTPRGTG